MPDPADWHLDVEPEPDPDPTPKRGGGGRLLPSPSPEGAPGRGWRGEAEPGEVREDNPTPRPPPRTGEGEKSLPPSALQIVEGMLFIGGPPLTAAKACSAVRGLTPDRFHELADELARKYRRQNRPYTVQPKEDGFVLAVKPAYRGIKERLTGGPREARLSQPALDALSLIAYRQPISKPEVDSLRGADSGGLIRQLVRLGLIAVAPAEESDPKLVRYATTRRFLDLFGLGSLDDLPRLADS
jgi:segregation and condensation protein B